MSSFPPFKGQTAEFIALADVEALVNGIKIPLHSQILARSSKVFAQLFSSLAENGSLGTSTTPTTVTPLLDREPLDAVLFFVLILYNPFEDFIENIVKGNTPTYRGVDHTPGPELGVDCYVDSTLLQATVMLADKLDCRYILDILRREICFNFVPFFDPFGWFIFGRKVGLGEITSAALDELVKILSARSVFAGNNDRMCNVPTSDWQMSLCDSNELLKDKRWLELDPCSVMLVWEAKALYNLKGRWAPLDDLELDAKLVKAYSAPGDLMDSEFPKRATVMAEAENDGEA